MHTEEEIQVLKKKLRTDMHLLRKAHADDSLCSRSEAVEQTVLRHSLWKEAGRVVLYMPLVHEVDTQLLLRAAYAGGKEVFLPRVLRDQKGHMELVPCTETTELVTSAFHLLEPHPRYPGLSPEESRDLPDLVLLPGLAFDRNGYRLGYGGGYFDRFFAVNTQAVRIGLCFSFQLLCEIPHTDRDQPVHLIVTEDQITCV